MAEALKKTEAIMGMKFGDKENPLLVSCRSGARSSMPGMMDTILNIGLCSETIPGMIAKTNNPRFVYDAYRRLIMMYSDVVMEKAEGIEPADGQGIRQQLDRMMEEVKTAKGPASFHPNNQPGAKLEKASHINGFRPWPKPEITHIV